MASILVVENNDSFREACVRTLRAFGHAVSWAKNATEAFPTLLEQPFDFVVTDMNMETEDAGLRVLRAAKKDGFSTKVVVISGDPRVKSLLRQAEKEGADAVLEKDNALRGRLARLVGVSHAWSGPWEAVGSFRWPDWIIAGGGIVFVLWAVSRSLLGRESGREWDWLLITCAAGLTGMLLLVEAFVVVLAELRAERDPRK